MDRLIKWGTWIVENTIEGSMAVQIRAILLLLVIAWAGTHAAWAFDKIPGFPGPAKQSDMIVQGKQIEELRFQISDIKLNLLRKDILSTQERLCKMLVAENKDALKYASQARTEQMTQYRALTGDYPQTPTCAELGIQ